MKKKKKYRRNYPSLLVLKGSVKGLTYDEILIREGIRKPLLQIDKIQLKKSLTEKELLKKLRHESKNKKFTKKAKLTF